jgi:hypothetical protein
MDMDLDMLELACFIDRVWRLTHPVEISTFECAGRLVEYNLL